MAGRSSRSVQHHSIKPTVAYEFTETKPCFLIAESSRNIPQLKILFPYHRNVLAVTGDRECCAPASNETSIMKISEKYLIKALACETFARGAPSVELRFAWTEVAIEWHALSCRITQAIGLDCELEPA
jgi:hypothetical protein